MPPRLSSRQSQVTLLPTLALADVTGPARAIDGDTVEVAGERIRLHGIDAPESRQTCRRDGTHGYAAPRGAGSTQEGQKPTATW